MTGLNPLSIDPALLRLADDAERASREEVARIDALAARNFLKVLESFRAAGLTDQDLGGTTGYGYGDRAREVADEVFARTFRTARALVRHQISSGTQSLSLCLFGLLLPGDEVLFATGEPYDTLRDVVGMDRAVPGCLAELGVSWRVLARDPAMAAGEAGGDPCSIGARVARALDERTRVVFVQRSRGYAWQDSLSIEQIGSIARAVKAAKPGTVVLVDNCYGEFVEIEEPTQAGADIAAGSLIKNPGGGLAPSGGYVAGPDALIERISSRLTAPGIGGAVGPTLGHARLILQGFFMAPHTTAESLAGTRVAARMFDALGYPTLPRPGHAPRDTVLAVRFGDRERLLTFCRGFHAASPVNAAYLPEPASLPGYQDPVIMAGGTFVQGASSELTVDAPCRPPYAAYLQGGLSRHHVRLAVLSGLDALLRAGLLDAPRQPAAGEPRP